MAADAVAEVRVPGDKSITHRALLLAPLARGTSRLEGLLPGEDPRSTAAALRALGAAIPDLPPDGAPIAVSGHGIGSLRPPAVTLDCGNSGTTARLLLGLLSGFPFAATLTGDASLRSRPIRRVTAPLSAMGARFVERGEPDRLPLEVTGARPLRALDYESPTASAQVKSAILLAGLAGGARVRVSEPVLSRDHTERLLRAMGVDVVLERAGGRPAARLEPPEVLEPLDLHVPGDFSSAAFFLALALLAPGGPLRIRRVGVNPTRTGLLEALRRMGATVAQEGACDVCGEPVADLVAGPAALRATAVGAADVPALIDEIPVLAALAARAEGETRITGAAELRVKESDRIAALVANLRAVGADAEELPDGLVVRGSDAPLAGRVQARGDHRIAMAFGVLGALPGNDIHVDEPAAVAVSFPGFWDRLREAAKDLGCP